MKVAFVTPEVFPFSKTGGLADVSASLAVALQQEGCDLTVFTPLHASAMQWFEEHQSNWQEQILPNKLWIGDDQHPLVFRTIEFNGLRIVFVLNGYYFDRQHPYLDESGQDYSDNVSRFAYFCRAVLEYYVQNTAAPDLFHVHDWQAALLPLYLKTLYQDSSAGSTPTLFTVHNLGYQGLFAAEHLYATGLGWEVFTPQCLEFYGKLNLLKAGIVCAQAVNTVSPSYAKEIQTAEFGKGLDGVLHASKHKLSGILNGIDPAVWDPAHDPHLSANYSYRSMSGKAQCKKALQKAMGLPTRANSLLLGAVSRFDIQKGIDQMLQAFPQIASLDLQLVLLGSGQAELEQAACALQLAYPQQVAVRIGHDEALAHQIEAGADAFLMPSTYEPCGLNQMYSQRYGTLPIVRETGGLKDTVHNATPKRIAAHEATGFTYRHQAPLKLAEAIRRAALLFHSDRKTWRALARNAMRQDFSWGRSSQAYLRLYEQLSKVSRRARQEVEHG